MFDFMTIEEAAGKWNVGLAHVRKLCKDGKIPGALKKSGIWFIPGQAEHPDKNDKCPHRFRGTKKRVFEAAVKLFARRAFDAVPLKEITDEAGLVQSAFYGHFKSKQEVLDAIYDYFLHHYIADRPNIADLDAVIKGGSPQDILGSVAYEFPPEYRDILIDCTKIVIQRMSVDERAGELFGDLILKSGLDYAERVYKQAIAAGNLPDADPYALSVLSNLGRLFILLSSLSNIDPATNDRIIQSLDTLSELIIRGLNHPGLIALAPPI